MIAVIDYNVGNLKSVTNALKRIGLSPIVTRDHEIIRQADGIILPGVGTFFIANGIDEELVAYCEYGEKKVTAIVSHHNVIGCQFHPEKSGEVGKKILLAFKEMVECC